MKKTCFLAPVFLCVLLAGCATHPHQQTPTTGNATKPPANSGEGVYKVGQPYQVNGQTYEPHEDYSYDETGIASWYGDDFHEQHTANGETFNKNELTAAHKTLPMPSLARVTNLDNGRSIVVRINDRGPFSGNRLIDVSQRAAQLLGFEGTGTAKVRVQVLADESKAIADAMRHYGTTSQVAYSGEDAEQPVASQPLVVSSQPLPPLASAPVQSETLSPVLTNPTVHQQLIATKPVAEVVQLPVTGKNQMFIQAGAFSVEANAAHMQQSLSRFGKTSISTVTINGTKFYRVRLGPVADVAHADAFVAKLKQSGITARTVID